MKQPENWKFRQTKKRVMPEFKVVTQGIATAEQTCRDIQEAGGIDQFALPSSIGDVAGDGSFLHGVKLWQPSTGFEPGSSEWLGFMAGGCPAQTIASAFAAICSRPSSKRDRLDGLCVAMDEVWSTPSDWERAEKLRALAFFNHTQAGENEEEVVTTGPFSVGLPTVRIVAAPDAIGVDGSFIAQVGPVEPHSPYFTATVRQLALAHLSMMATGIQTCLWIHGAASEQRGERFYVWNAIRYNSRMASYLASLAALIHRLRQSNRGWGSAVFTEASLREKEKALLRDPVIVRWAPLFVEEEEHGLKKQVYDSYLDL